MKHTFLQKVPYTFIFLLMIVFVSCEYNIENGGTAVLPALKNPSKNEDLDENEDINKVLVSQKEEDIFLYAYDEFNDKYERFILKVNGYEMEFISSSSKMESWLPVIYTSDLTGDNENEIVVIVTTGSGTGIHTEDIFIYNHDLSIQYKILPVLDVIGDIITVTSDNDSYTISSKYLKEDYIIDKTALGEPQDRFVEEPYFNTVYQYHIIDSCIYAEVGIGIGFLEYYDENIIIKYRFETMQFTFDGLYIGVI